MAILLRFPARGAIWLGFSAECPLCAGVFAPGAPFHDFRSLTCAPLCLPLRPSVPKMPITRSVARSASARTLRAINRSVLPVKTKTSTVSRAPRKQTARNAPDRDMRTEDSIVQYGDFSFTTTPRAAPGKVVPPGSAAFRINIPVDRPELYSTKDAHDGWDFPAVARAGTTDPSILPWVDDVSKYAVVTAAALSGFVGIAYVPSLPPTGRRVHFCVSGSANNPHRVTRIGAAVAHIMLAGQQHCFGGKHLLLSVAARRVPGSSTRLRFLFTLTHVPLPSQRLQ
jgi:hypothetical protein